MVEIQLLLILMDLDDDALLRATNDTTLCMVPLTNGDVWPNLGCSHALQVMRGAFVQLPHRVL